MTESKILFPRTTCQELFLKKMGEIQKKIFSPHKQKLSELKKSLGPPFLDFRGAGPEARLGSGFDFFGRKSVEDFFRAALKFFLTDICP
jgi:hypothetical protein